MDFALGFGLYLLGIISGSLVAIAVMTDRSTVDPSLYQQYGDEPTETGIERSRGGRGI